MPTSEYNDKDAGRSLSPAMVARVVERLKALADENRVRIVLRLKDSPSSVSELAKVLGIGQPSVSKHLAILKQVGLVEAARQGTTVHYAIRDRSIFELCALVCDGVSRFANEQHEALRLNH